MKKGEEKRWGFTIIEVSLVLAIAGLIFLMVFVALPALQRNQRDTKRRADLLEYAEAIVDDRRNNREALPTTDINGLIVAADSTIYTNTALASDSWGGFYRDYLPKPFEDPSGTQYSLRIAVCGSTAGECSNGAATYLSTDKNRIVTVLQATCSGEHVVGDSNPKKIAILYKLEGGGIYCNSI